VWFLEVGVFLFVLAVSSKQLLDTMKKVWKPRETMKSTPLKRRCFVMEFGEEFILHALYQERTMWFQERHQVG
jgi:hypothetical protein